MTIALIVIAALLVVLVAWAVLTYNRFVSLRVDCREGLSEIDVQLKRRHDLIPNLVETVRGYATHERGTLEEVTRARAGAVDAAQRSGGDIEGRAQAEGALSAALGRLFAVAEAYPDLKANQNFLELQRELSATEDKLAAARRFYNNTVEALNTKLQQIPANVIGRLGNFQAFEFFQLTAAAEAEAPAVRF